MIAALRRKVTFSNAIAGLALFVALGGIAVAAAIPKHSVGPRQLKRGAVTTRALRRAAVTPSKLGDGSVTAAKLAAGAVGSVALQNGGVTTAKLAKDAVTNPTLVNGAVGNTKLANEAVTTAKLKNGSVTIAKVDPEILTTQSANLRSGQTLRGVVYVSGSDPSGGGNVIASSAVSFQFPLAGAPNVNVVDPSSATTAACPGNPGKNPKAAAGQLCIYVSSKQNALTPTVPDGTAGRFGFALETKSGGASGDFNVIGQWAVTAP
jgi:hypothetical protein